MPLPPQARGALASSLRQSAMQADAMPKDMEMEAAAAEKSLRCPKCKFSAPADEFEGATLDGPPEGDEGFGY